LDDVREASVTIAQEVSAEELGVQTPTIAKWERDGWFRERAANSDRPIFGTSLRESLRMAARSTE